MNHNNIKHLLFTISLALLHISLWSSQPLALKCEHLVRPIGVDQLQPRFTWQLSDQGKKGIKQAAFRITVDLDSMSLIGERTVVWNSGKVTENTNITTYQGKTLQPFTRYFWRLDVWDEQGKQEFAISSFETGMMGEHNWQGTWISDGKDIHTRPAGYFRKTFVNNKKLVSARAYIAAAGLYEFYLNGQKVGNHRLDPMYTRFDRRNLYVSYDVTKSIQDGKNAIGILLGNGWYNHQALAVWNFDRAPWRARPAFCMDLRLTYNDGSVEVIKSGGDWKSSLGAVVSNNIYTAEHYDARLEKTGWSKADYDDSKWQRVALRAAPSNQIVSQLMYPIRNVETIKAKNLRRFNDTTYLFDLGRNIAGVSKLQVKGAAGTVIKLKHAERLDKNGRADLSNIDVYYRPKDDSDPFQTDIVILKGEGLEEFMPKFNYKGFRYVEVTSSKPIDLKSNNLTGYFMHSDVPAVGQLKSSNTLINKIWWATNNSYLSNLFGFPTDCPQREKNGWTGDGHFAVETGLYNFDALTVYEKWMGDHRDEQQPNGVLPDIIPTGGWGYGTANGTDWTSTIAIIPWNLYQFYGDDKALKDNYEAIKKYVGYVERNSVNGLTKFGRGDWVPVKSTSDLEYTSSVYFYVSTNILAKAAEHFGKLEDASYYNGLAQKIRNAINQKFFDVERGIYGKGVQTELSMALHWGIVEPRYKEIVASKLAQRVKDDQMHIDVGVLGAKAVLNALSDNGYADVACRLATQDTYPGWGWWIANGATTLLENWDLDAKRDISDNHMMFGEIGGWFFKGIGGVKIDPEHPGFKHFFFKPHFSEELTNFEVSHESPYGTIVSSWIKKSKRIRYKIKIPANSSATMSLTIKPEQRIYLGGKEVANDTEFDSGDYEFEIR